VNILVKAVQRSVHQVIHLSFGGQCHAGLPEPLESGVKQKFGRVGVISGVLSQPFF
jgi:hypothetical protein